MVKDNEREVKKERRTKIETEREGEWKRGEKKKYG